MSANLIETIQQNLQYPPLQKVDPNKQDVPAHAADNEIEPLAQAAIPAVLTGLFKLSRNDEGCAAIIQSSSSGDSLALLFGGKEGEVLDKVASYAAVSNEQAEHHLENIADEAIRLAKTAAGEPADKTKLKQWMSDQRHTILVYLPASLHLGEVLQDETLDDKTNKMEGPISSFMHKIENKLSQGGK